MRHAIFRFLLVGYATLLVIGAWPFESTPVLTASADYSKSLLDRIGVRSGLAVFSKIEGKWTVTSDCIRITGEETVGQWRTLYESDCPAHANWHHPLHQLMRYQLRHISFEALQHNFRKLPPKPPESLRRIVALGDMACHSRHFGATSRRRVRLDLTQSWQHVRDDRQFVTGLDCEWVCNQEALAPPHCASRKSQLISPAKAN